MSFFLFRWIHNLFGKEGYLKRKVIPVVIEAVNNVKNFDSEHPEIADLITKLIPGQIDDEIKAKLRQAMIIALEKAGALTECLKIEDTDARIACIIAQLQSIADPDTKALKWAEIAAYATKYIAEDERLDINEIAALVKMVYNGHNDESGS